MSTKANTNQSVVWINAVIAIGVCIWIFKGCTSQRVDRDAEMMGRGMLEAKGIYGELPPTAGRDFYGMMNEGSGEYKTEDYQFLIAQIRAYQEARSELRKRGLSDSDLSQIDEYKLYEAMRSDEQKKALDDLAKQYD